MRRDRAAIGFMLDSRVRSGSRFNVRPVMRYFARLLRWNRPIPTVEPRATGELERIVTPC
ncbi:MAG: hypothetical protein IPK19_06400 [Chloroflexi bacterium]|nr:hypothetical protein [Chloroflexota bacterium]